LAGSTIVSIKTETWFGDYFIVDRNANIATITTECDTTLVFAKVGSVAGTSFTNQVLTTTATVVTCHTASIGRLQTLNAFPIFIAKVVGITALVLAWRVANDASSESRSNAAFVSFAV
jgi:hypothetical protein